MRYTFTAAMMPLSVLRSVARRCLAAAAMFGFSLNVATPTIAHGCAHPAGMPATVAAHASHGNHDQGPAPSGQTAHGKKCECVGHSCGTALAVASSVATGPRGVPSINRTEPVYSAARRPANAQHLLPFAVGPPSSVLA